MESPPSTTESSSPACPGCGEPFGSNWMGHEIDGVYDGVLYWSCTVCGIAWSRDWSGYGKRAVIAQGYVDAHNTGRQAQA